jgi:hypothetical protein
VPPTVIVPPTEVWRGEATHDVKSGQKFPSTNVPLMMTEPFGWVTVPPVPQTTVTFTRASPPAARLNGMLVPVHATPAVVVASRVTVSPVLAGKLCSTEAVAFGSLVLIVPVTSAIGPVAGACAAPARIR